MSQIKTKYIADNAVTNNKAAKMAAYTIKGNNSASLADPSDLTGTQTTALLDNVIGDSGSGGTKGLVPAPASGDAAAGKFLKADGTWAVPPSASGPGWTKYTLSHADFQTAATSNNIALFTLTTKGVLHQIVVKHATAFAGTGITAYTVSVGIIGELQKYVAPFNVFQSVSNTARSITQIEDVPSFTGSTNITINAISTGANLDQSTAGSVEVWTLVSYLS